MLGLKQLLLLLPAVYAYKFTLHEDAKCGKETEFNFNSDGSQKEPIPMWLDHKGKTNHNFTIGSVRLTQLCGFRFNIKNGQELFDRYWSENGEAGKLTPLWNSPHDVHQCVQFPPELAVKDDPTCFPINPDIRDDKGEKIKLDGDQLFYINGDLDKSYVYCPDNREGPPEISGTSQLVAPPAPTDSQKWLSQYIPGVGWTSYAAPTTEGYPTSSR